MKRLLLAALALAPLVQARAEAVGYTIDTTHTTITFAVLHAGLSTLRGGFKRKQGLLQFDRAGRSGHVEMTVETASVDTGVPALDRWLAGPALFDSAAFPSASFVGDGFRFDGDRVAAVSGTLTLHGRTRPLTLTASRFNCYTSPLFRREVCGGDFEATLQRSQWGLDAGLPDQAADDVRLLLQVEAIRQ